MASYVAGSAKLNDPFVQLTFNDQNSSYNTTYNFNSVAFPVSITKLIVITTRETASASEDFINGLKPYLDVHTFGDTTNGKPVGMIGIPFQTSYMFWPIAFSLVNSAGQGGFYKGFAPDKYVPDDFTHDWSDRNEACLKEAIYYLENGTISSKGLMVKRPALKYTEKNNKNNNAYIFKK